VRRYGNVGGCAQVAELVDALVSGTSDRKVVEVRVLSWAVHRGERPACTKRASAFIVFVRLRPPFPLTSGN
jgi:hypothetical protein